MEGQKYLLLSRRRPTDLEIDWVPIVSCADSLTSQRHAEKKFAVKPRWTVKYTKSDLARFSAFVALTTLHLSRVPICPTEMLTADAKRLEKIDRLYELRLDQYISLPVVS